MRRTAGDAATIWAERQETSLATLPLPAKRATHGGVLGARDDRRLPDRRGRRAAVRRIVGHNDHASIIAHSWVWEQDRHIFKLSDERTERAYWVHAILTPWQAKLLLEEHGGTQEEELQRGTPYELGHYGYASS
jgi:hypothetical protein